MTPVMRDRLESAAFTVLCGGAAECRFLGEAGKDPDVSAGAESDRHKAIEYAEYIAGLEERALNAYLEWMRIVTENLIADPVNWEAAQRVAAVLLEPKHLTYREVRAVAWG
jgi:hypothetical protein